MSSFREIVTKAVVGKAKKSSSNDFSFEVEEIPNTILGCWVINNTFSGSNNNGVVDVSGSFDVNVWYSYDNDTKTAVSTKRFSYFDKISVPIKNNSVLDSSAEIIVKSLKQPTVSNAEIVDGKVKLTIDKEMGVEIVGNTKVKIAVEDNLEDDYVEVFDEQLESEIDNIKEDYLDIE